MSWLNFFKGTWYKNETRSLLWHYSTLLQEGEMIILVVVKYKISSEWQAYLTDGSKILLRIENCPNLRIAKRQIGQEGKCWCKNKNIGLHEYAGRKVKANRLWFRRLL